MSTYCRSCGNDTHEGPCNLPEVSGSKIRLPPGSRTRLATVDRPVSATYYKQTDMVVLTRGVDTWSLSGNSAFDLALTMLEMVDPEAAKLLENDGDEE